MKLLTLINQYWKNFLIVALLVLLFIAFKKCGGGRDETAKLKSQLADTKKEKQKIEHSMDSIFKKHSADSATWAGEKQLALIETKEADNKVKQQQKTIDKLVAVIRNEPAKPDSSTMVLVTPEFKEACEDLPAEVDRLNRAIAEKDTAINEWSGLLAHEVQERDNTIESLRIEINKGKRLYDGLEKIAETAIARAKPRGAFLLGIGVMGNQEQFLGGASVKAAYLTKGGKMYQYSPHVLKLMGMPSAKLYHELSVLFNPFK